MTTRPGLARRCGEQFVVERRDRQQVDDVGLHSVLLLQLGGGLECGPQHGAVGDQGDVPALSHPLRLPERNRLLLLGHLLAEGPVDGLRFVEDDRVRVADGAHEQRPRVARAGRDHHLDPGHVRPVRLAALRVVLEGAHAAPVRGPQHHGDVIAPLRAPAQTRGVVLELVHRVVAEAVELHLADRFEPVDRHPDRNPGDGGLGQRGVHHAPLAELRDQAVGHAEDAAVDADVLAEHDHAVVLLHLLQERQVERLHHGHLRHRPPPWTFPGNGRTPRAAPAGTVASRHRRVRT